MASYPCLLPVPGTLEIHDSSAAENWKDWKMAWEHYSLASGLREKPEEVQVSTLLTIIGPEARKVFSTFSWANAGDSKKMGDVLAKLEEYCCPRQNVPFERYKFNMRQQAVGETFDHYVTELRQLAGKCAFETITTDELLRDRIVFGIIDSHVRERLLWEDKLTLKRSWIFAVLARRPKLSLKQWEESLHHRWDQHHIKECSRSEGSQTNSQQQVWKRSSKRQRMQVLWKNPWAEAILVPSLGQTVQHLQERESFSCKMPNEICSVIGRGGWWGESVSCLSCWCTKTAARRPARYPDSNFRQHDPLPDGHRSRLQRDPHWDLQKGYKGLEVEQCCALQVINCGIW